MVLIHWMMQFMVFCGSIINFLKSKMYMLQVYYLVNFHKLNVSVKSSSKLRARASLAPRSPHKFPSCSLSYRSKCCLFIEHIASFSWFFCFNMNRTINTVLFVSGFFCSKLFLWDLYCCCMHLSLCIISPVFVLYRYPLCEYTTINYLFCWWTFEVFLVSSDYK